MPEPKRIVLTGGPCGGKSTALAKTREWLSERGHTPFIVPEAATHLIQMGLRPTHPDFQRHILDLSLHQENLVTAAANEAGIVCPVIIYDRGVMDQLAYIDQKEFEALLSERGLGPMTARDARYDGVISLQTAAVDAEEFYTLENNAARSESTELARTLDRRTTEAWIGHPHLRVIENRDCASFDEKMHKVIREVTGILGIPQPIECEYKYRVLSLNETAMDRAVASVSVDIVQTYLTTNEDGEERVRARGQRGEWLYYRTIKTPRPDGSRIELERIIKKHEHDDLLLRQKPGSEHIRKRRTCFLWEGQYFELDTFEAPERMRDKRYLEIELTDMQRAVKLPPFLEVEDVTGDARHSNAFFAGAT